MVINGKSDHVFFLSGIGKVGFQMEKTSDGLAFRAAAPLKRLVLFVDLNIDPPSVRTAKCV